MMNKTKQVFPKYCLKLVRGSLCDLAHYPSPDSLAFQDLHEDARKEAEENRCGRCKPGSTFCKPSYTKKFREKMGIE